MKNSFLDAFVAVALTRNLTKAADQLNVTQSTVSYRLRQLESYIGVVLIKRDPGFKETTLTSEGEQLLPLALSWLELSQKFKDFRRETNQAYIEIGAIESVNLYLMPLFYKKVFEKNDRLKLNVRNMHSLDIMESLYNRKLDLGLITDVVYNKENLMFEELLKEDIKVVTRTPIWPSGLVLSPSQLNKAMEVYIDWGEQYQLWRQNHLSENSVSQFKCDSLNTALPLLSENNWIFVPASVCHRLGGGFMVYSLKDPQPRRSIYLVSRIRSGSGHAYIQDVNDFIIELKEYFYNLSGAIDMDLVT